jgi:cysteine-rich repeat protein
MRSLALGILGIGLAIALSGCTRDNPGAGGDDLGGGDDLAPVEGRCGDGVVDDIEQCDDGNGVGGDGCENDCTFTCAADQKCDDGDPCNGAERCDQSTHVCAAGSALADGARCGSGRVCRAGVCVASSCGDGVVTPPEECDDGNVVDGDGCDSCRFGCVSGDATRDCTPADACAGQGRCDDATHTCIAGTPIPDLTACPQDASRYCKMGVCRAHVCNDGNLEPGELCDDGNLNQTDGCRTDCTYSCATPATDCGAPPACQKQTCSTAHVCQAVADPTLDGTACGSGLVCNNGACAAPGAVCGNGVKESGEDCDFGALNGPNSGCEAGSCRFSCTTSPNRCDDGDACNGVESCVPVIVDGKMGQRCQAGTPLGDGTPCAGGICVNGKCQAPRCSDGVVTPPNEECEPPGTATCDANCKAIVCGNGRRDSGEQCDDGAKVNTDGCSAACGFEQAQRASFISMELQPSTADRAYCPSPALNGAISPTLAGGTINTALANGIADGSISVLFAFRGLDDLSGVSDGNGLKLGVLSGAPRRFAGDGYDGTRDLDWWYDVDPLGIDAATRLPLAQLDATLSAQTLAVAKGSLSLKLTLAGAPAELRLVDSKLTVGTRAVNAPLASTMNPPGHLPAEHLDPALRSFSATGEVTYASNGTPITTNAGKLCGNVTAASLAQVPVPEALGTTDRAACQMNAGQKCGECYLIGTNSLLDVVVGGCTIFGFLTAISATQPDRDDSTYTPPGGPYTLPYRLTFDAATRVVNGCQDSSQPRKAVPLADCLKDAAYSSFFKFTTRRVILK